jgi:hypothetical protein
MHYMTRHLEALGEFSHGDSYLVKGERFFASHTDAEFYLSRGKAKPVPPLVAEPPAAVALPPAPAPAPAPAVDVDVEIPAVDGAAAEPDHEPAADSAPADPAPAPTAHTAPRGRGGRRPFSTAK